MTAECLHAPESAAVFPQPAVARPGPLQARGGYKRNLIPTSLLSAVSSLDPLYTKHKALRSFRNHGLLLVSKDP